MLSYNFLHVLLLLYRNVRLGFIEGSRTFYSTTFLFYFFPKYYSRTPPIPSVGWPTLWIMGYERHGLRGVRLSYKELLYKYCKIFVNKQTNRKHPSYYVDYPFELSRVEVTLLASMHRHNMMEKCTLITDWIERSPGPHGKRSSIRHERDELK